ncbi:hypothetical protein BDW02DRAFT_489849 [Decorospora gaudefroyi]|uniref:Rhodopsin domain-containing protein n=1 Tax=Decorospora gaudefroyi TaxID=184978 RepID=A0A6A5KIE6_9PLEO|nr:hypothetical protein BDW02DRAFT_489849 [Decorospora gaudefroyi]
MFAGYRQEDVPGYAIDFVYAFKLQYALSVEYNPCICMVKASFLWSLYKLRSHNPWIKRSILGLQALNAVYMVATTIVSAVPCLPIAKAWHPELPGGCYSPTLYVTGNVSVVILTDFLVLLIPTWMIWDLQMPVARKLVTISFLSLGFIVIAIGIARLFWLLGAFNGTIKNYSVESAYGAIESSVAIIGTSGPTIKYLLSRCIPWLRPSFERSTANKPSHPSGYGNYSNVATKRRARSQYGTQSGYDDLDSESVRNEIFEMKSGWHGKRGRDDDERSDEQRITGDALGISKTVEWTVHTREEAQIGRAVTGETRAVHGKPAASPAHIV